MRGYTTGIVFNIPTSFHQIKKEETLLPKKLRHILPHNKYIETLIVISSFVCPVSDFASQVEQEALRNGTIWTEIGIVMGSEEKYNSLWQPYHIFEKRKSENKWHHFRGFFTRSFFRPSESLKIHGNMHRVKIYKVLFYIDLLLGLYNWCRVQKLFWFLKYHPYFFTILLVRKISSKSSTIGMAIKRKLRFFLSLPLFSGMEIMSACDYTLGELRKEYVVHETALRNPPLPTQKSLLSTFPTQQRMNTESLLPRIPNY